MIEEDILDWMDAIPGIDYEKEEDNANQGNIRSSEIPTTGEDQVRDQGRGK
ncbi:MAG: hypothetical protein SVK08_00745 [Halobacteriota archaeon]|nr:hypothetical protein [Halobacteriota archaeon]